MTNTVKPRTLVATTFSAQVAYLIDCMRMAGTLILPKGARISRYPDDLPCFDRHAEGYWSAIWCRCEQGGREGHISWIWVCMECAD